jgi:regulator of CtrA degradation
MRLTTRLMQLASWLLLHRAVKEGEMSLAQANKEKTKVKLSLGDRAGHDTMALLPERLRGLIDRSLSLLDRVRRLDATMHSPVAESVQNNAVERQLGLLRAAFEREAR